MSEQETKLGKDSLISIGLALTMMAAAFSFAVVYTKVLALSENVTELTRTLTQTREQLIETRSTNAQILDTLSGIKSDVNEIRKSQRK